MTSATVREMMMMMMMMINTAVMIVREQRTHWSGSIGVTYLISK